MTHRNSIIIDKKDLHKYIDPNKICITIEIENNKDKLEFLIINGNK